jgi:hypothetical protein
MEKGTEMTATQTPQPDPFDAFMAARTGRSVEQIAQLRENERVVDDLIALDTLNYIERSTDH